MKSVVIAVKAVISGLLLRYVDMSATARLLPASSRWVSRSPPSSCGRGQ